MDSKGHERVVAALSQHGIEVLDMTVPDEHHPDLAYVRFDLGDWSDSTNLMNALAESRMIRGVGQEQRGQQEIRPSFDPTPIMLGGGSLMLRDTLAHMPLRQYDDYGNSQ